jgi:hypothetical protein
LTSGFYDNVDGSLPLPVKLLASIAAHMARRSAALRRSNTWRALDRTPAGDQVEYQYDHSYDQQEVNQVATEVADEPQ